MGIKGAADIFTLIRKKRPGCLFVFTGPSGTGKSTICRAVLKDVSGISFSVSHTTRQPRPDEVDGRDYYFVSEKDFESLVKEGRFVEYAAVHGYRYGTSRDQLEEKLGRGDALLDVDVQGASQIRARYPSAPSVFILPPSLDELRARLVARGQNDPADIERRISQAELEVREAVDFDYFVVNDSLEDAVAAAKSIIEAERHSLSRRLGVR
ncbi:MAG TPA: guanylate kinase [bacterium]|nr:guanylate kinase [bacterium]